MDFENEVITKMSRDWEIRKKLKLQYKDGRLNFKNQWMNDI